jgi:hypothetical protein
MLVSRRGARRVSPLGTLERRYAIRSFAQGFFAMSPDTTIELAEPPKKDQHAVRIR